MHGQQSHWNQRAVVFNKGAKNSSFPLVTPPFPHGHAMDPRTRLHISFQYSQYRSNCSSQHCQFLQDCMAMGIFVAGA